MKQFKRIATIWWLMLILIMSGLTTSTTQAAGPEFAIFPQLSDCLVENSSTEQLAFTGTDIFQLYQATSTDGLTFTADNLKLLNRVADPDALFHNNTVRIYFVNELADDTGIWVAQQMRTDSFERVACVKLNGRLAPQATDPDVVRVADDLYRLFYVEQTNPTAIFSAVSDDGLDFTIQSAVVTGQALANPTVVQLTTGEWLMAYHQGTEIAFASSPDGDQFSNLAVSLPDVTGTPELMALPNGQARLLVSGETLHSYLSEDGGQSWQLEQPAAQILNQPAEVSRIESLSVVSQADSSWHLFYVVSEEADEPVTISGQILLQGRTSHDGVTIYLSQEVCSNSVVGDPITTTDEAGMFEVTFSVSENYRCLQAYQPGFLIGQRATFAGELGSLTLLGGDVNGDSLVNIFDLALIAASYDSSDPLLDLNDDGLVDIFDLTTTAVNYNKRGPLSWTDETNDS